MPSSLSSLLADKLGLSEEHAHTLLERLAEAIRDHADETGVHVSGLGTFRRRDGALTFEPDDALAQRVNQRFEGLEPEASPAALSSASPADDASPQAHPPDALLTPRFTPLSAEAVPDSPSLHVLDETLPGPPAVWAPHPPTSKEGSQDAPARAPADEDGSTAGTSATSQRRPARPSRDRSTGPRIVAAALVVLFLLGAGWLILGQQGVVSTPQSVLLQQSEAPTTAESDETATPAPPTADTGDTAASAPDDTTDTPTGTSPDEPAADGRWTLVVASRDTRTAAEDQADTFRVRLADIPLPINIRTAETDNTTRHRVVVGDFSSRDAALEAMDEHQSLLPEGVWLLRLE